MNYKIYNNNSKDWVLLIHGLGGSINTWKYQIEDLNGFNILAVDLEGHGDSEFKKENHLLSRSASEIYDILEKRTSIKYISFPSLLEPLSQWNLLISTAGKSSQ